MIYPRDLSDAILKDLASDYIQVIVGARQTGKTTLLKSIQDKIKSEGKPTLFINLEDLDYLKLCNDSPKNIIPLLPLAPAGEKVFLFIDEIQHLDNPTNFLKLIYDEYHNRIKLIVSGSSAFYIDKKFKDSLEGRKRLYWLTGLNFHEFLIFRKRDDLARIWQERCESFENGLPDLPLPVRREMEQAWNEYATYGFFPRVVLSDEIQEKIEVIRDLVNSLIKKDVSEAGINRPEKFYELLRLLSGQIGSLLNVNELANTLSISVTAVQNYLFILQKSFHIAIVRPFTRNLRKELTKMPKVYFLDLGFRNFLVKNFEPNSYRPDAGQIYENLIYYLLIGRFSTDDLKFWRTQSQAEVDFIIQESYAVEVKRNVYQFTPSKYKTFLTNYTLPLIVIYKEGEPPALREELTTRIQFVRI